MSLCKLPIEIIYQFSFYLLADTPLGPPNALPTLALVSRSFNAIVTSKPFLAKLCRFKFDVAPVKRRCFHPRDRDLADELIRCCRIIQDIRRADLDSFNVDDTLCSAYFLMLNNDGKNYAQLEYAGLDAYVDRFVRTKLWEERETNQGWPLDNINNSFALWLMWMTLTKEKLLAESLADREQMILLTLPYVALPHRYSAASAPPNHFNLPLDPRNPYHQPPLVTTLSPSTPYPIYFTSASIDIPYFNSRISICAPLTTIAAKLLFVARKEVSPIRPPPHLPQGPGVSVLGITQDDYREINASPGAKLCTVVTWDWDTGCPRRVGEGDGNPIGHDWEESKVWDTEWWRRLLCYKYSLKRPKYLPGEVFKLGSMRGSWHGKEYIPQGHLFVHFLRYPNAYYPGLPDQRRPHLFTEASIGLSMKPVFLNIQEHHKICECPPESSSSNSNTSESHPYVAPTLTFNPNPNANAGHESSTSTTTTSLPIISQQTGRCGVIPVPAPLVFVNVNQSTNQQATHAGHDDHENEEDEDIEIDESQAQTSNPVTISLPPSSRMIDYSMSNAWFPGHIAGVTFAKMPSTTTTTTGDGNGGPKPKRDKIVCAVDFQVPDVKGVLNRPEESECLVLGGRRRQQQQQQQQQREKMNAYVYETYDPDKVSMHRGLGMDGPVSTNANSMSDSGNNANASDPHKCPRCIQREALIRLERKKVEERSKMILDRRLRSYGRVGGVGHCDDEDMYYSEDDEDEEGDYDNEMQDIDVTGLNIDLEGIDRVIAESSSSLVSGGSTTTAQTQAQEDEEDSFSPSSSSSSPMMSFGDDQPYGQPGAEADDPSDTCFERTRRCYDKCRIGVECSGVGDVLLSGETGPRHAVWQQYTMYGRVRPWDGLIGILRIDHSVNTMVSNIFIFGYIVGEDNFVGEWRVAASDPLRPTWGSAIVMSRRVGGGGGGGQVGGDQAPGVGVAVPPVGV